jgi:large repetitive protein
MQKLTAPCYGKFEIATDGVWIYTPVVQALQYLRTGESLTESVTILSFDGTPKDVVITIDGAGDVPVSSGH